MLFLRLFNVLTLFVLLLIGAWSAQAQSTNDKLVQLSGVVISMDSIQPVIYANIYIKGTGRGTISNANGYFSFVARKGDVINFSAIGYQDASLAIPDTVFGNHFSVVQPMSRDTVMLPEALVLPWPTPEEFKEAFLNLELPNDDLQRARKNLERETLREISETMAMDANENADYQFRQYSQSLYSAGQYPHYKIFDPFAWAKFIKALKNGDFKRKK